MSDEELDLVTHELFEGLAEVEVEMACVVALDLALGCGARVAQRLGGWRDAVGVADTEQDGEIDLLCRAPGPVRRAGGSESRRDLVAERRLGRQQRLVAGKGVR